MFYEDSYEVKETLYTHPHPASPNFHGKTMSFHQVFQVFQFMRNENSQKNM